MNEVKKFSLDNDNIVVLTEACESHVLDYMQKNNKLGLRLSTKKSGCSGLAYVLDYIEEIENQDDIVIPFHDGYKIFIDKLSYPYLKNITIDYIKEGLNYKFVFNNPNQTGQCGCGESFTVDNF